MGSSMSAEARQRLISRAGALTILVNLTLTVARGAAAFLSGSTAVLADAANSGTDILATLVVLGGSRIAALPPDRNHPYGHEKAEPVAAKFVGIIVTIAGLVTGTGALQALRSGGEPVGAIAAVVTAASIAAKEALARYLARLGRRIGSQAVLADAANQRTDVLASAAALAGALGGRFGLPLLDPVMGLAVSGLILRMGLGLYWQAVRDLMDRAPDPETMALLRAAARSVAGVREVGELKARVFGPAIHVDCKVSVDEDLTVAEGHRIGKRVKAAIMRAVPECRNVLVHVNPYPGIAPDGEDRAGSGAVEAKARRERGAFEGDLGPAGAVGADAATHAWQQGTEGHMDRTS
ncbi:cation diffusion facilitator family transporter [Symbiobacterium terraclitae]|uniref:Cation diffusion facilitator family transporter n=1 Tax=Symbiobacterium terraclitae TaxID=557451 RepID=A0ABS4JYY1_9FIRM|nr:cation diffusion facilitator family transporter [Symbiobacterium terraclitae]MBP2019654.1 cation diffusion facilitator family transporter [Symbiobacterium terraclitae]